jgi:hypothetical protein
MTKKMKKVPLALAGSDPTVFGSSRFFCLFAAACGAVMFLQQPAALVKSSKPRWWHLGAACGARNIEGAS